MPPLAMPDRAGAADPDRFLANSSLALLPDRARSDVPDPAVTPHDMEALAENLRTPHGLPLALEVAARRAQALCPR